MINVISHRNGSGLEIDYAILQSCINREFTFTEWTAKPTRADINIFIELINPSHFPFAKVNILLPNQEWFEPIWEQYIPFFDAILCKTKYAYDLFKKKGGKVIYTSFTSFDRYDPSIKKELKLCHLPGKSKTKGTESVIRAWQSYRDMPELLMIHSRGHYPRVNKVNTIRRKLPFSEFNRIQNQYLIHLCPSKSEGFGHYINEAMSCKSVVIAVDASPMNELVTPDRGVLIKPLSSKPNRLGHDHFIGTSRIKIAIEQAMNSPELGEKARQWFLENDAFFKSKIKEILE